MRACVVKLGSRIIHGMSGPLAQENLHVHTPLRVTIWALPQVSKAPLGFGVPLAPEGSRSQFGWLSAVASRRATLQPNVLLSFVGLPGLAQVRGWLSGGRWSSQLPIPVLRYPCSRVAQGPLLLVCACSCVPGGPRHSSGQVWSRGLRQGKQTAQRALRSATQGASPHFAVYAKRD